MSATAAYVDMDRFTRPARADGRGALARDAEGDVVGYGSRVLARGARRVHVRMFVDPTARRRGVGRALGRRAGRGGAGGRSHGHHGRGRRSAARGEPSPRRPGFRADLVDGAQPHRRRGRSPDALLERWRAAGEAAAGYSLVAYDVPCPSDELARDFIHARHVMNDAPRYEGEAEATYTVEELRAVEAASVAAHQGWWNVGVRHDATGELVGHQRDVPPGKRPWIVFQGDTGVDPRTAATGSARG